MTEHDGILLSFKSIPEFWHKEYNGRKPNTERITCMHEAKNERLILAKQDIEAGQPASIMLINTETQDIFFRRIEDISVVGDLLGQIVWVISWKHEDGIGTYRDPEDVS